ncbi:proteasome subunit beta [Serinibacter salmoneus]|nr:proteasome subunit beta [Serinibacter salmoneus]
MWADGAASFLDLVRDQAPDRLLAWAREPRAGEGGEMGAPPLAPHATTIVALTYPGGVVMAGDRRATSGTHIAHHEIEKVFPADDHSAVGIAGAAGVGLELVRLFQLELEHYEKIEGTTLSLEGKANRLAHLVRGNLPLAAAHGLLALPLLAGFDAARATASLYSFDAVGGRYTERRYHAIGSGSPFARGSLKATYRADGDASWAIAAAVAALMDAAEDDSATGGVDLTRGIFPVVAVVDAAGYRRVADGDLAGHVAEISRLRTEAGRE